MVERLRRAVNLVVVYLLLFRRLTAFQGLSVLI